jgi:putative nucleotidyltransferase with HDIG domain
MVRSRLQTDAYRGMPRLFVLAEALHHASMQAWALGATDTISRPFDAKSLLRRIHAAFPDSAGYDATHGGKVLNRGVAAAHAVIVKMFEDLPSGVPLRLEDIVQAENKVLKAIKHSSLREWLTAVGCHHTDTYRHCLFVTGFAVAFAQHLGMREEDQRRLTRAALLHDVGKAFIPVTILDKPGKLTDEEMEVMREHPRRGYEALAGQGGFPPEMLDVVLHHHELLDGSGYPHNLAGDQISDIVRLTTIADIYSALIEERAYRLPFTHTRAFSIRWARSWTSNCCRRSARSRSEVIERLSSRGDMPRSARSHGVSGRAVLIRRNLDQAAVGIAAINRAQRAAGALFRHRTFRDGDAMGLEMSDHLVRRA